MKVIDWKQRATKCGVKWNQYGTKWIVISRNERSRMAEWRLIDWAVKDEMNVINERNEGKMTEGVKLMEWM